MNENIENLIRHSQVSEKSIEKYLADMVRNIGGLCLKYSNSNMTGYPDRIILLPNGVTLWVELKSKGKKPSVVQQIRFEQMRKIGHQVHVIDNKEDINELLSHYDI